jgi:hypothetical protein
MPTLANSPCLPKGGVVVIDPNPSAFVCIIVPKQKMRIEATRGGSS